LKLEAYRQGLVKVIKALVSIDDTLAFWPYEFPNSPESDLLNNPSALGTSIHQILQFFDEFRINKFLYLSYVNCLIGFNMDFGLFMQSTGVMLEDIPARIDKRSLQVPHITPLGWLFGTHEDVSIPVLEQVLNDVAARLAPNQVPAIQFGLSFKPIWDGVSKKDKKKDQDHTKWAIHVEAIAEIALTSKAYLKQVLLSPEIKAHTNLPLLLVPILQKKTSSIESKEIKRAIAQHSTVLLSISKSFSSKILSLRRPLPSLSNATLCTTLMAVTTPEGKKLFLSAYPNWNGQGFIISYPTIYAKQAYDFVEYLPAYLSHSHGEEIYRWFTPDAVNEAKAMGWDVDKKQPISQDGLALRTTLQNLNLEWCIAAPSASDPASSAVDLDNLTIPSFNMAHTPPQAQPGAPSTAIPLTTNVTVQHSFDTQDDLMMASTINTRLSALEESCALLPLIMKWLDALAPPLSSSTATGSTSTPAVPTTPSVQPRASGGRD